MGNDKTSPITSAEMAGVWGKYINETAVISVLKHFLAHVDNELVRTVLEKAFQLSEKKVEKLKVLFTQNNMPLPVGFNETDVNEDSDKLFSDQFYLFYLKQMALIQLTSSCLADGMSTRSDIVEFFQESNCMEMSLHNDIRNLLLNEGLYVRPPIISPAAKVDFVTDDSFLGSFFEEKRPLSVIEISHLFMNIQNNHIGKMLMLAFAQVSETEKIRDYFLEGKKLAQKHMDVLSVILKKEDLPISMVWDTAVTKVTKAPFSEKLMLFHVTAMTAAGFGNYGMSASGSPRKDIALKYIQLSADVAEYAEDGAKLMMKEGWLEEPPHAPHRSKLRNT